MSRREEYLLVHAFYTFCLLCIAFITALSALGIIKTYYPSLYTKIVSRTRKLTPMARWERTGRFNKVAHFYRTQAKKRKRYKLVFLGIANLYEYSWEQAIPCLENYIEITVGKRENLRAKNYLAIANLQGGNYHNALRLFEECRSNGSVHIIPYVLTLLLLDKVSTARDFYEAFPAPDWANPLMKALIDFDKRRQDTLTTIQHFHHNMPHQFHLFKSTIASLVSKYELELYFQTEESFETLRSELKLIAVEISQQPGFFESPRLQWYRKFITESAERIPNRVIWFQSLDTFFAESPETKPFQSILRKLHWLHEKNKLDVSERDYIDFFHAILPQSAEQLISYEHFMKYKLFKDERLNVGFQMDSQYDRWDNCMVSMRILPLSEAAAVYKMSESLLLGINTVPGDIRESFHRVLYDIFITRKSISYWQKQVLPFIETLQPQYQRYFEEVKQYYLNKNVSITDSQTTGQRTITK